MKSQLSWVLLALLLSAMRLSVVSFVPTYSKRQHAVTSRKVVSLFSSSNQDDEDEAIKRKMALVRTLQQTFYNSDDTSTDLVLDHSSGIIENLPLWRVPWTELPGRSNVLNVHEAIYTNMFEKILYGKEPRYVGHLYLPGGSKNLKSKDDCYRLKSWEDVAGQNYESLEGSAVVGTLLRIVDFRRMSDGRLLLLVQGLERFVVSKAKRELPYSIADVQLLPDLEEMDGSSSPPSEMLDWVRATTESNARIKRKHAIAESIRYHEYEYDASVQLPVPERDELSVADVVGSNLVKVLPFVPFSARVDPASLRQTGKLRDEESGTPTKGAAKEQTLESRLLNGGILREPSSNNEEVTSHSGLTAEELEIQLWICIDEYLRISGGVIRPELLSLLPPNKIWPKTFLLEEMAISLASTGHYFVRVTDDYPAYRRQKRFSYAAAALLENTEGGDIRQALLEIPSTQARLCTVLEQFELITAKIMGEFL